jgi:two-component system chemotaxis response regulator CheB
MKIRAMIVDPSEESRMRLSEMLESSYSIEVVCKLGAEKQTAEMVGWISPDVVLVDVSICKKDSFKLFDFLMRKKIPILVICNKKNAWNDLASLLERGAIDVIFIPGDKKEIIKKVRTAAMARPLDIKERLTAINARFHGILGLQSVVVIASSTGGPQALRRIIPKLPKGFPCAIIIVQHMGKGFTRPFAERLDKVSEITVKEAEDQEKLKKGVAYIAPNGFHLEIEDSRIALKEGKPINGVMPSADYTMKSVAKTYGADSVGVVLTGMGRDGAKGIKEIKRKKGRVIAQDRESSVIFGMPKAALMTGNVDKVLELEKIPEALVKEAS